MLMAEFDPQSPLEFVLVDRMAAYHWRLRRPPMFEVDILIARNIEVWENPCEKDKEEDEEFIEWKNSVRFGLALTRDAAHGNALGKLDRHETALMNAFSKTLQTLLLLQERRGNRNSSPVVIEAGSFKRAA